MKRAFTAILLSGVMALTPVAAPLAMAEENTTADAVLATAADETLPGGAWQADYRLAIEREKEIISQSGLTLDEWDAQIAAAEAEGLSDPITLETLMTDTDADIQEEDGSVYFIGANSAFPQIHSAEDAYRLLYQMLPLFGGSENTDMRLWSKIDFGGISIYSFQQISDSDQVLGSTVKIAVLEDGTVSAVFNALDAEATKEEKLVTREEAEEAVTAYLAEQGADAPILSEETSRVLHTPYDFTDLVISDDNEETLPEQVWWVVYTPNTLTDDPGYPYLAHYVSLDGTYQYSLPTEEAGGAAVYQGYETHDVFTGMSADTWTGEVTGANDSARTITVPVMYNEETGKWYLGDCERRIAIADHSALAYADEPQIVLVESDTNDGWDNEDLLMLYNYILAWDFYADLGWISPDGAASDVVILKDLCLEDGTSFQNACSVGRIEDLQMFGYSGYAYGEPMRLTHGLDVMAHEYTHTLTSTLMNTNLYENDQGAINEAMSDIMGNIVEQTAAETEDTQWLLGENIGSVFRSMSEPNDYQQPDYVWDIFYGPHAEKPTATNDHGGVHYNSSLLNRIAAKLCIDHGMTLEEAAVFWIMTACGLTPRTDYVQIGSLLNWALEVTGLEQYKEALNDLIQEEHLDRTELPEKIEFDREAIKLQLPDSEIFQDDNWALFAFQLNTDTVFSLGSAAVGILYRMFTDPDNYDAMVNVLLSLAENLRLDKTKLKLDNIDTADEDAFLDLVADVLEQSATRLLTQYMTWREAGTNEMTMMVETNPTIYGLFNISDQGSRMNAMLILLGDHWIDLGALLNKALPVEGQEPVQEADMITSLANMAGLISQLIADYREGSPETAEDLESTEAEEESSPLSDALSDLAENGVDILRAVLSGEEISPELLKKLNQKTLRPHYLPTAGLDNVEFIDFDLKDMIK